MSMLNLEREAAAQALQIPGIDELDEVERASAIATWRGRMLNEHISARVFASLVPQMMAAEVSASHIHQVAGFVSDELRHGVQCAAVVHALGAKAEIEMPDLPAVPEHADVTPLEGLLRNILSVSCLSETVAVSLIDAERQRTGPPALEELLRSILADEVGHARFGWKLLDELAPRLTPDLRERLGNYLVAAFRHLREHELAHLPPRRPPTERSVAYGVCDGHEARELFFATVDEVIIPGLEAHGLPARRAWEASLEAPTVH